MSPTWRGEKRASVEAGAEGISEERRGVLKGKQASDEKEKKMRRTRSSSTLD